MDDLAIPHEMTPAIEIDRDHRRLSLEDRVEQVAAFAATTARAHDNDGAFPSEEIRRLGKSGLLRAPLPSALGGIGLGTGDPSRLRGILSQLGRGSLALGRLYEGHVNAVVLVIRYGSTANLRHLQHEIAAGRPSGVWMAGEALKLEEDAGRLVLSGRKVLCSGAGHIARPLVAAETDSGSVMLIPRVPSDRVDISGWVANGMRATATGIVDFTGIAVQADEIVGRAGDYTRSPYFRGGAWRVLAVQFGGLAAVFDLYQTQLATSPHADHPIQLARFGEAAIAFETARLWVDRAAQVAEGSFEQPDAIDAYVDLARNAFETAALTICASAQKAIGLKAFLRANELERVIRDLTTYLRQPALDASLVSAAAYHVRQQMPA